MGELFQFTLPLSTQIHHAVDFVELGFLGFRAVENHYTEHDEWGNNCYKIECCLAHDSLYYLLLIINHSLFFVVHHIYIKSGGQKADCKIRGD